jgi:hypothetical protein
MTRLKFRGAHAPRDDQARPPQSLLLAKFAIAGARLPARGACVPGRESDIESELDDVSVTQDILALDTKFARFALASEPGETRSSGTIPLHKEPRSKSE